MKEEMIPKAIHTHKERKTETETEIEKYILKEWSRNM